MIHEECRLCQIQHDRFRKGGETTSQLLRFSFYDDTTPIYTSKRNLPPSMINDSKVVDSIISYGCVLDNCSIEHSVIGLRSHIGSNVFLKDTVMYGADFYEADAERARLLAEGWVPIGIGENTTIRGYRRLIDLTEGFYIRDGIPVIVKNSRIGDGMVI